MLEIFEASHGGVTSIAAELASFDSAEQVVHAVSSATGVPAEHVLLFLDDGRDLKDEVLQELWERGGQGSQSDPLYLFNRQTFFGEPPEHWAEQAHEELFLPPPLNLSAISDLSQAQIPFVIAHDHLQHLYALLQAQCAALSIAYDSLGNYLDPILAEWDGLSVRAKAELDKQYDLLKNSVGDMALLGKISVLDALAKRRDRERSGETDSSSTHVAAASAPTGATGNAGAPERTMASYVNASKMEQVREACRVTHEGQVKMYDDMADRVGDLAEQSNAQRTAAASTMDSHAEEFRSGIYRMEDALKRLGELFEHGEGQALTQDLMELDGAMREDLAMFTDIKNDFTLELHYHIKQVAQFQIAIAELIGPLNSLEEDLTGKAAFPHLQRLHQLPFAYAATVVEVVRRKQLTVHLQDLTQRINAEVAAYLDTERARRSELRESALNQLPWTVGALEEDKLEWKVSLTIGNEMLAGMQVGPDDVQRLLEKLNDLVKDPVLAAQETNPVPNLVARTQQLFEQSSSAEEEFRSAVQKALTRADSGSDGVANTRAEDTARIAELEQQLHERDQQRAEFDRILFEAEDLQYRLQREAEAAAEAQWAAEAELREKAAEYERERDEMKDVIGSLQADVEQDKSRINDLGVRLQEALLDVDGLKNAEQAYLAQVQELQEERSKHLTALSEAQSSTTSAQSELAGLRAEMQAMSAQLAETRVERDNALRNQSAEAERLMRDRIAEADGDRAVLEHQNLTLTKALEDAKVETEQKLSAARNAATRTADGLKAELSFTKAQLRDVQRRESVLADELALAKDKQASASLKETYSTDVAKDAVALAGRYHEACARLLTAILASSTIANSGAGSSLLAQSKVLAQSPEKEKGSTTFVDNGHGSSTNLRDSILLRSLATAQSFDLDHFSASVTHTISLVRKLGKTCRHYRDQMRSKISFTSFAKGDLALFLPTRNANTRPWMAYNIAAPHHFLKLPEDEKKRDMWKGRDSIVARITSTDESVAGDTAEANPFGLAEGLRFYIHTVEEYVPTAPIRAPRRSNSASVAPSATATEKVSPTSSTARAPRPSMGRPAQSESALAAMATSPSVEKGEPFPALSEEEGGTESGTTGSGSGEADDEPAETSRKDLAGTTETVKQISVPLDISRPSKRVSSFSRTKSLSLASSPERSRFSLPPVRPASIGDSASTSTLTPPTESPPLPDGAKLSPVFESFSLPPPPPTAASMLPPPKSNVLPPFAVRSTGASKAPLPTAQPPISTFVRPTSAASRALASPQPSVRPCSRSSTHTTSSIMTGLLVSSKGTPAPAMAVTASGDGGATITSAGASNAPSPRLSSEARRASIEARRTTSGSSVTKPTTGLGKTAVFPASSRNLPSPFEAGSPESETGHLHASGLSDSRKASMEHTLKGPLLPAGTQAPGVLMENRSRSGSISAQPVGLGAGVAKEEGLGTSKFWTLTRKRLPSFGFGAQGGTGSPAAPQPMSPGSPTGTGPGSTGRSSAQDMLRRFDS